ncbi:MAG: GNAT family N-acetyltransferase, partial [Cyclobacteriaceae bacterium]|nr:GNAT family N-acetyltransferase [Cyclobacteriaceae bacterium]
MARAMTINDIHIRTDLKPGDAESVIQLHDKIYREEYHFGSEFQGYVAAGFQEFLSHYDPATNRVWVCEHKGIMIGFMLLMNRWPSAQLRYFLIEPEYRGIGLGKKLMESFIGFMKQCGYTSAYLWTTNELPAAASLYIRHGFT